MWTFVNSLALALKAQDPAHPVGVAIRWDSIATAVPLILQFAPAVDFLGVDYGVWQGGASWGFPLLSLSPFL